MDANSAETNDGRSIMPDEDSSTISEVIVRDRQGHLANQPEPSHESVVTDTCLESKQDANDADLQSNAVSVVNGDGNQRKPTGTDFKQRGFGNSAQFPIGSIVSGKGAKTSNQSKNPKPIAVVAPLVVNPSPRKPSTTPPGELAACSPKIEPLDETGSSTSPPASRHSSPSANSTTTSLREMTSQTTAEANESRRKRVSGTRNAGKWNGGSRINLVGVCAVADLSTVMTQTPEISRLYFDRHLPNTRNPCSLDDIGKENCCSGSEDHEMIKRQRTEQDRELLLRSNFYYPRWDRRTSKTRLRDSSFGTFLIRSSSDPRYEYVLSLRTRHGVTSVRLVRNSVGLILLDCDDDAQAAAMPAFPSVLQLIDRYLRTGDRRTQEQRVYLGSAGQQKDVVLDLVKAFEETPGSLAHLCRKRINGLLPVRRRNDVIDNLLEFTYSARRQVLKAFLSEYPYRF